MVSELARKNCVSEGRETEEEKNTLECGKILPFQTQAPEHRKSQSWTGVSYL